MASEVAICNRALQMLGAKRITSITDDSVNGRACNACYETIRDSELRAHPWSFAKARAELAAISPAPTWGRGNAYQLPADFIRLLKPYPEDNYFTNDNEIEGQTIVTDKSSPIRIRYIYRVTDPNVMDPLFRESLATQMAIAMCEEITQSNTKKKGLQDDYKLVIDRAKAANAFERVASRPPEDLWITARY